MKIALLQDRRAYTMTFWALFIGLVVAPLMALSIEIGRFFAARAQISAAADAAANLDVVTVLGLAIFSGAILIISNLIVDVVYAFIDPRVRLA